MLKKCGAKNNDGYKGWGVLKNGLSNRGLGICKLLLYEVLVIEPTALHEAEA